MQHGGYGMKKVNIGSVKIIPLGGLEQIGMNITASMMTVLLLWTAVCHFRKKRC